jgi:hypothetical protein
VTVELLPLDPVDLVVEVVRVVKADMVEGELNRALAAANTAL